MEHWYPKRRFGDLYDEAAARWPDRDALVYRDRRYTFREAAAKVDEAARALIRLGVGPGEHVSTLAGTNCDDWIFIHFALAKIGAVSVPINTRFRSRDLAYVLKQSDSAMLIAHDVSGPVDYLAMLRELDRAEFPCLRDILLVSEAQAHEGFGGLAARRSRPGRATPEAEARAARGGGRARRGRLHHVHLRHHRLPQGGDAQRTRSSATMRSAASSWASPSRDTMLNYLPLFHAFGYSEGAVMSPLVRDAPDSDRDLRSRTPAWTWSRSRSG